MKVESADNTLSVIGELDRYHLVSKSQFVFPKLIGDAISIDLAKAQPIDTSGLAWLLKCVSFYSKQSKQVTILNAPAQLIALAELSNVLGLLPLQQAK